MTVRPPNKRGGCSTELGGVNTLLILLYIHHVCTYSILSTAVALTHTGFVLIIIKFIYISMIFYYYLYTIYRINSCSDVDTAVLTASSGDPGKG